ncbi:unnamed protein product, partial [Didymodactylos carnosus]
YGGHQEHKLAQQLNAEANACETDAIAASAYAAQMEAGKYNHFAFLVAMQARTAAQAASQQAGMYAAEQSVPLAVRAPAPAGGREGQQRQEQQQTGGHTTSSQSGGLPQRGGTDKR